MEQRLGAGTGSHDHRRRAGSGRRSLWLSQHAGLVKNKGAKNMFNPKVVGILFIAVSAFGQTTTPIAPPTFTSSSNLPPSALPSRRPPRSTSSILPRHLRAVPRRPAAVPLHSITPREPSSAPPPVSQWEAGRFFRHVALRVGRRFGFAHGCSSRDNERGNDRDRYHGIAGSRDPAVLTRVFAGDIRYCNRGDPCIHFRRGGTRPHRRWTFDFVTGSLSQWTRSSTPMSQRRWIGIASTTA